MSFKQTLQGEWSWDEDPRSADGETETQSREITVLNPPIQKDALMNSVVRGEEGLLHSDRDLTTLNRQV